MWTEIITVVMIGTTYLALRLPTLATTLMWESSSFSKQRGVTEKPLDLRTDKEGSRDNIFSHWPTG